MRAWWILLCLGTSGSLHAASISLDQLAFDPAAGTNNRIAITIQTNNIGSDSDVTDVTGIVSGILDYQWVAGEPVPVGFTFQGGEVALSDVGFSFLFGLVSATTQGIRGTPSTPNPPSAIQGGTYQASDHTVTFHQGTIMAGGSVIDLATDPISGAGTGTGTATVVSLGPSQYEFTIELPVEFNEPFEVANVPVVGTLTGNILGSGRLVARQRFSVSLPTGDYNGDGNLDCADMDVLQAAIAAGSSDLTFDANQDGRVSLEDYLAWITDLKGTLPGDANLDFRVDGTDFGTWNSAKFQDHQGWCAGDFTGEGIVDGSDFNVWNVHKFQSVTVGAQVLPEPQLAWWGWMIATMLGMRATLRRQ